ncbi:hypothetical protein WAI453_001301 [Rhynchosporium graminicola]
MMHFTVPNVSASISILFVSLKHSKSRIHNSNGRNLVRGYQNCMHRSFSSPTSWSRSAFSTNKWTMSSCYLMPVSLCFVDWWNFVDSDWQAYIRGFSWLTSLWLAFCSSEGTFVEAQRLINPLAIDEEVHYPVFS